MCIPFNFFVLKAILLIRHIQSWACDNFLTSRQATMYKVICDTPKHIIQYVHPSSQTYISLNIIISDKQLDDVF